MPVFEQYVRPLNAKDLRLLNRALATRRERLDRVGKNCLSGSLLIFGVLWLLTIIATRVDGRGPNWWQSGLIWLVLGSGIGLWGYRSAKRQLEQPVQHYESALRRNEVHLAHIESDRMVEFEEEEDEGACYAFQVDGKRIVFVSGQQFYPSAKFPNSDFSIIRVNTEDDFRIDEWIEKNGRKLKPIRRISAKQKSKMRVPEHLEVIEGDLDHLEGLLMQEATSFSTPG